MVAVVVHELDELASIGQKDVSNRQHWFDWTG